MKLLVVFKPRTTVVEAVDASYKYVNQGYTVVLEEQTHSEDDRMLDQPILVLWGTKNRTLFTGGWNR